MSEAPVDVAALRRDYTQRGLRRAEMSAEPVAMFREWFETALAAGLPEPNAMSLATADASGVVTARTVLLKGCDERGFVFFTNLRSAKARQIAVNPQVALLFPWLMLERQVAITGRADKVSRAEVETYFHSRPFGSRLGACASEQSEVIAGRAELEARYAALERQFTDGNVPVPEHWGGFRVAPVTVEFWQGRTNRLHDRFRYTRTGEEWRLERLSP